MGKPGELHPRLMECIMGTRVMTSDSVDRKTAHQCSGIITTLHSPVRRQRIRTRISSGCRTTRARGNEAPDMIIEGLTWCTTFNPFEMTIRPVLLLGI